MLTWVKMTMDEIKLTAELSVSSVETTTRPDSTVDEKNSDWDGTV